MENQKMPTLALSDMFFDSFAKLPSQTRKKVQQFLLKFRQVAASNGINYEKIREAPADYRSARIDDNYRAVICHPEAGNVYLLLWVDKHEEAYRWARTHVCNINPTTGSLQVYETQSVAAAPVETAPLKVTPPLFKAFSDEELKSIGVPESCLPAVRRLHSREDLENERPRLPLETFECLVWLSEGESLDDVHNVYGAPQQTNDPEEALKNTRSHRTFCVIETDEAMRRLVDSSLERWRVFLHPSQKKLVERTSLAPMLVRGAAGTGKTVVALHRAVHLVRRADWPKDAKLLFTTYTRNLAVDIEGLIKSLCANPAEKDRIEVVNFDAWAADFLRRNHVTKTVVYPGKPQYEDCWTSALTYADPKLGLPDSFYTDEWNRIILPQEIETEQEYLRASRKGRGTALGRMQRKAVWPVFEEMRTLMSNAGLMTIEDATFMALHLLREHPNLTNYGAVVVDETQDFGNEALTLLAQLALPKNTPNAEPQIFLVGDGQQRIYNRHGSLASCGINVRGRRSERLKLTYRTTDEIRRAAEIVLNGAEFDDMDGEKESVNGNLAARHGSAPEVFEAASFDDECTWIGERIHDVLSAYRANGTPLHTSDICVVTRTNALLARYETELKQQGFATKKLSRKAYDDSADDGIRFATMHRVKGLEYRVIFIVGADEGVMPLAALQSDDTEEIRSYALTERSLFYVAASRAKDLLFVSASGTPGEFIKMVKNQSLSH